ncbi:MAG: hypothetical protein ACXWF9_06585 [Solirubrobacterales bacterium]
MVLGIGLVQIAAGAGVLARATHYPLWSGAILVLNLFLLYALLVPAAAED